MEHQEFEIEEVDVQEYCKRGERVPHARPYIIRVDKQRVISLKGHVTGAEILALVGKTPGTFKLYQHQQGHQPSLVAPDHLVDLTKHGVERFTTMPKDTSESTSEGKAFPRFSRFASCTTPSNGPNYPSPSSLAYQATEVREWRQLAWMAPWVS